MKYWVIKIIKIILITAILFLLSFVVYKIYEKLHAYYLTQSGPVSALDYYEQERAFVQEYVRDPKGGYFYWVDKDGSVKDSKKYSLFHSNIILWLGGLESQKHDEQNLAMMKDAADYLVKYLYKGNGEWYEFDSRNHRSRQEFFWNPRSESYISFALFQAYHFLEDKKYLDAALATNQAQRTKNPEGRIFAEFNQQDIGFRFPEEIGHYEEYKLTGNLEALEYARAIDRVYRGVHGKENVTPDGFNYYYHGMTIIDKLLYSYLDANEEGFAEGSSARDFYWSMMHDDAKHFDSNNPGESSDNGRDYYDKRLAMDMIEWSKTYDSVFAQDAVDSWYDITSFWDFSPPYGFMINTEEGRKTCFTIGMTQMMMDLTGPTLVSWEDSPKSLFNHQATFVVKDPWYTWNTIELRGIGVRSESFKIKTFAGISYGKPEFKNGPCDGCVTVQMNYIKLLPGTLKVEIRDLFGNMGGGEVFSKGGYSLFAWDQLNISSLWYYTILTIFFGAVVVIALLMFIIFYHGKQKLKKHERR